MRAAARSPALVPAVVLCAALTAVPVGASAGEEQLPLFPGTEVETYVKNHIRRALDLGATEDEIFEAVQCLIFPAGGPSLMMGIKCLRAVLEDRKA